MTLNPRKQTQCCTERGFQAIAKTWDKNPQISCFFGCLVGFFFKMYFVLVSLESIGVLTESKCASNIENFLSF